MNKVKILIVGYGNVGRGVQMAIERNADMELIGIASRTPERVKKSVGEAVKVYDIKEIANWYKDVPADVAILCGGSKSDLAQQTPVINQYYPTIDSFDNHSQLPEYFSSGG